MQVNGQRICQTVALFDGNIIGIGHAYLFRYFSAWVIMKLILILILEILSDIEEYVLRFQGCLVLASLDHSRVSDFRSHQILRLVMRGSTNRR